LVMLGIAISGSVDTYLPIAQRPFDLRPRCPRRVTRPLQRSMRHFLPFAVTLGVEGPRISVRAPDEAPGP